MGVVCGSQRVVRRFEGLEQEVHWCGRTDGPCPFAGTDRAKGPGRPCASEGPGRGGRTGRSLLGTVVEWGGGFVRIGVDDDTERYPPTGMSVEVSW